jgi:SAM-dependent methyltransferase
MTEISLERERSIVRYGKSMFDILDIKSNFFHQNDTLLNASKQFVEEYKKQPIRVSCKLCESKLPDTKYFTSHEVDYFMCECCGQLNGLHQDIDVLANAIYSDSHYGKVFYEEHSNIRYTKRLESIYMPKAKFLIDSLSELNVDYENLNFLDVGAGSGYMVGALHRLGVSVTGIEISLSQVEYGNRMLGNNFLHVCSQKEIAQNIANTKSQVLSFISVFEHISDLSTILENIKNNPNIKYVFFSVPLFSLSCVIEAVFPNVFNRQLGGAGGHTHLFSPKSLEWMYKKYRFIKKAEWYFGTDMMDLYRAMVVMLEKQGSHKNLIEVISNVFKNNIDGMQFLLDRSNFSSEIHTLVQIDHS